MVNRESLVQEIAELLAADDISADEAESRIDSKFWNAGIREDGPVRSEIFADAFHLSCTLRETR